MLQSGPARIPAWQANGPPAVPLADFLQKGADASLLERVLERSQRRLVPRGTEIGHHDAGLRVLYAVLDPGK
jgi:hypothetical protein